MEPKEQQQSLQTEQQQQEQQDESSTREPDKTLATWLRRTRAQVLRRAAVLAEDPTQGAVEARLLQAAQLLQEAGELQNV